MTSQWSKISTKNKGKMLGAVKRTTKKMAKDVVSRSPVDTGRFKSNWNAALNSPDISIDKTEGGGFTSVINSLKIGDKFYFTNNLPYALRLEYGWSDQAPGGMVRLAIAEFPFTVNKITAQFINKSVIPS